MTAVCGVFFVRKRGVMRLFGALLAVAVGCDVCFSPSLFPAEENDHTAFR